MEDSNSFNRDEIAEEINSILKQARDQSRYSKSQRVTFNFSNTKSINEKPQKSSSLSSKSVVRLMKENEKFSESQMDLELKLKDFKAKLKSMNGQDNLKKSKKKPKMKLRKVTYRLKKPVPAYDPQQPEFPELEEADRPILINYFKEIANNFHNEKRRNRQLNESLKTYLLNRKIKKAFEDDSDGQDNAYYQKYYQNLEKIHGLRQEIKTMKEAYDVEKMVNSKKKEELIEMKNACLQDFQATVYSKAQEVQTTHPISEKSIKKHLNTFFNFYDEVSKLRMANFKTQQLIAKYVDKEREIEEIGDGLTLFDYENTKTKLQIVTSNIDAKNKILEKMRMRIKKDTKDDQKYTQNLKELDTNLQEVNETLHNLKEENAKLFNESRKLKSLEKQLESKLNDIYIKGQLLSERSLMIDYDKMDEKLNEKKDEVAILKDENQKLDKKLRKYEEELKTLEKKKAEKVEKNVEPLSLYEERVALFRKTRTS
ncbi:hypothetical protein ACKWTF_006406 [Chironomus riparius]